MRTIKFRAWDKHSRHGSIGNVVMVNWSKNECIVGFGDPEKDDHVEGWGNYASYGYSLDEVTLMQFTGLTDRHGKEIYEGDIISRTFADGTLMSGDGSIVRFGKVDLGVNMHEYPYWVNGFYAEKIGGNPSESMTNAMLEGNVLVIGNIYENPELLMVQP